MRLLKILGVVGSGILLATVAVSGQTDLQQRTNQVALSRFQSSMGQASFACNEQSLHQWEDRFCGSTGYIDAIRPEDFAKGQSTFCGIDPLNRAYIAIRYACESVVNGAKRITTGAGAVFQRYTDASTVVWGGHHIASGCKEPIDPVYDKGWVSKFKDLLSGKTVTQEGFRGRKQHFTLAPNPALDELPGPDQYTKHQDL